ncbi:hypothetical protein ACVIM9_002794 [Bradyrhizobium sp. USDA 4520]
MYRPSSRKRERSARRHSPRPTGRSRTPTPASGSTRDVFASLNGKTEGSKQNIERVKKVVETIRPAAEKAGLELDGLGEFGKLGRGNIIALGAAITTTFVTAMEKAGDTARSQAQRLGAFTGSAQNGVAAYKELQKTAGELKVPTSTLTNPFEQITRTHQRFGGKLSGAEQTNALKSLFTGAEADRVEDEQANPAIRTFLTGLREGGRLTPELATGLGDIMPTLMKRLLQDLQTRLPNANVYSAPETLRSLGNILPQLEEDQRTTQSTFGTGISQAIAHLKAEASKLGDSLNGTQIVSTAIDGAAKFLGATAEGIKAVKEARHESDFKDDLRPNPQAVRATSRYRGPGDVPLSPDELGTPGVIAQPVNKILGGEGDQTVAAANMDHAAKSAENLSSALDRTADSADAVTNRDNALNQDKAIAAANAKLAAEQAGLDEKYQPEALDLQLGRDQLAVQNAALAKQSAQIGVQDATKNKELADLAPEQAENAARNAESRYSKALKNLRQLEGYDTSAIQDDPLKDARNELRDADTARRVADVNRRYAYLEPQKAELAQQKAQTDLTSADYLQRESDLKFTKDNEGRKLSSEVTSLRYMDAQLKQETTIAELTADQKDILAKILSTLEKGQNGSQKSEGQSSSAKSTSTQTQSGDARSSTGSASSAQSSSAPPAGRDLVGSDGVVNIPQGATQEEINKAFAKQRAAQPRAPIAPTEATRPGFYCVGPGQPEYPIPEQPSEPRNQYEFEKEKLDAQEFSAADGKVHQDFTKGIRRQMGVDGYTTNHPLFSDRPYSPDEDKLVPIKPQRGIVPHPKGGKADLSERMTIPFAEGEEGPYRYRYEPSPNYEPPTLGGYGADGTPFFRAKPNKDQPYPRLREKPFFSDRPYSPLEDTFDFKGSGTQGDSAPIYDTGQNQPITFPQYNQYRRDTLPVPLPQPRPPEAGPGQQSSLPSTQEVAALGDAFRSLIEGIASSINSAKQQDNAVTNPEAMGIRGEGENGSGSEDVAGLGETTDKVEQSLDDLAQAVSEAANTIKSDAVTDEPTYAATGGLITGPGSRTSDSIPAMLSRDEFVVNADAAQKHLGLLHAINNGKEIGFKHLAVGGPVGFMDDVGLPHVSARDVVGAGGAEEASHPVNIHFSDGRSIGGLSARRSVVDDLKREAAMSQLASGGTAPSWVGT